MAWSRLFFHAVLSALWLVVVMPSASPVFAISPEEQLADPALEERARTLSRQLRCLVCQNQSIEDSDAELAQDLRREVRSQIVEGKPDGIILQDLRNRYGDYILLNPPLTGATYILWSAPIFIVIFGFGLFWVYRRSSHQMSRPAGFQPPVSKGAEDAPATDTANPDTTTNSPSAVMIGGLVVLILIIATSLYSQFGSPQLPAQPLSQRADEIASTRQAQQQQFQITQNALLSAQAEAEANPEIVDSWLKLAMAAARAQNSDIEIAALNTALELTKGNLSVKSMLAEAMARKADGLVTLRVRKLVDEVLARDPDEPRALYLSGLAAFQDEAYGLAIGQWQRLRQISSSDAPWLELVDENIAQAAQKGGITLPPQTDTKSTEKNSAPLLSTDQIEAVQSMSAEEQQAFILNMVDQLEERLASAPEDKAGWQRLVSARKQIGDNDAILRALDGAAKADLYNPDRYLDILEFLLSTRLMPAHLERAETALGQLRQLRPDSLEGLFFAGHIAQLNGNTEQAIESWQILLDQLEEDSPLRPLLASKLDELR